MAIDLGADIVLLQNGVYALLSDAVFVAGARVYAFEEDCAMRGIAPRPDGGIKLINYAELVDVLQSSDHVIGML
ncbi:MAG TPA: DsrH/TusB family sulfur metabolism protein [Dissulfurispiraceae bacterium]|nr:DsrH/TusB family sulfur metabolism protein [Dissulfurispiraceae bacterium]